jgi:hypothetical protein
LQVVVPREVMRLLIAREQRSGIYRTRLAANVLCNWASSESGQRIAPYHDEHMGKGRA